MKREELGELHYITPIVNVPSMLMHGILSNKLARKVGHVSCASQDIQQRRAKVILPNGKPLHDYANLYFNARNPMMHVLKDKHNELAVLAISPDVLDIAGVIISDQNAARDYALFKPSPNGLEEIDPELVFAERWTHPNPIDYDRHKGIMCAEVLIPDKIGADYILKVYVSSNRSRKALVDILGSDESKLEVVINSHLFFQ